MRPGVVALFSSLMLVGGFYVLHLNYYLDQSPLSKFTKEPTQAHSKDDTMGFGSEHTKSVVSKLVQKCYQATNISRSGASFQMLQEAKANAKSLFREFRKVIPKKSLDGYGSHCWRESYSVQWNEYQYSGHIGNIPFSGRLADMDIRKDYIHLLTKFPGKYESKITCLPKVFLIGYFKCGSSFVYKLIHKLISLSLSHSSWSPPLQPTSFKKEPIFWVKPYYHHSAIHYSTP